MWLTDSLLVEMTGVCGCEKDSGSPVTCVNGG
jgi:hypothetical protein